MYVKPQFIGALLPVPFILHRHHSRQFPDVFVLPFLKEVNQSFFMSKSYSPLSIPK